MAWRSAAEDSSDWIAARMSAGVSATITPSTSPTMPRMAADVATVGQP